MRERQWLVGVLQVRASKGIAEGSLCSGQDVPKADLSFYLTGSRGRLANREACRLLKEAEHSFLLRPQGCLTTLLLQFPPSGVGQMQNHAFWLAELAESEAEADERLSPESVQLIPAELVCPHVLLARHVRHKQGY